MKPLQRKYQQYYQNESQFNDIYSKINLTKIVKDGVYVINLDENDSIGTYWFAMYIKNDKVTCFDGLDDEHIPKEIKMFIVTQNIIAYIFRLPTFDSVMSRCFCIEFIDFLLNKNEQF